jgi:hypothetical protein
MTEHADILGILGIDHSTFNSAGEDIELVSEEERKPHARVFRKGGKTVYRAGSAVNWYDDEENPVILKQ